LVILCEIEGHHYYQRQIVLLILVYLIKMRYNIYSLASVRKFWEYKGLQGKSLEIQIEKSMQAIEQLTKSDSRIHDDWMYSTVDWELTLKYTKKHLSKEISTYRAICQTLNLD
jgi:hypothetical protein